MGRGNRGTALAQLFEKLSEGDPFTWAVVGVFFGVFGAIGLFVLKVRRDLAQEDAELAKRYGKRK